MQGLKEISWLSIISDLLHSVHMYIKTLCNEADSRRSAPYIIERICSTIWAFSVQFEIAGWADTNESQSNRNSKLISDADDEDILL